MLLYIMSDSVIFNSAIKYCVNGNGGVSPWVFACRRHQWTPSMFCN